MVLTEHFLYPAKGHCSLHLTLAPHSQHLAPDIPTLCTWLLLPLQFASSFQFTRKQGRGGGACDCPALNKFTKQAVRKARQTCGHEQLHMPCPQLPPHSPNHQPTPTTCPFRPTRRMNVASKRKEVQPKTVLARRQAACMGHHWKPPACCRRFKSPLGFLVFSKSSADVALIGEEVNFHAEVTFP